jgi:pimeloyl-ACP methyl ester carboxylesterase
MEKPHSLLLPGLLNDARLWAAQVSGLGEIAEVSVGDITVADTIPLLAASVLARVPAKRFALAGLSMGGYVALEIMRQAPDRVIALALLDTSARPDTPQATEGRRALMKLAATDFPAVIDTLFPKLVLPSHAQDPAMRRVFTDMAVAVGADAFLRQQAAIMGRIDSRPFLRRIACPTLILCGREDAVTPPEIHEEMAAAIPGAMLEIVEDCGHLSAIERPEAVTKALKTWLSKAIKS